MRRSRWKYLTDEDCKGLTFEQQKQYDSLLNANVNGVKDGILQRQTLYNRQDRETVYDPELHSTEPAPITVLEYEVLKQREKDDALRRAKLTPEQRHILDLYNEHRTIAGVARAIMKSHETAKKLVAEARRIYDKEYRKYDRWWVVYFYDAKGNKALPEGLL